MTQKQLDKFKKYYDEGACSLKQIDNLLKKGKITQSEHEYITGGATK